MSYNFEAKGIAIRRDDTRRMEEEAATPGKCQSQSLLLGF